MKQKLAMLVLYYLRFFARLQLRKNKHCQIIGITGSAGKSSTRNAIYSVLKDKYRVKASFKANSESGIPLDILGLEMRDYSALDWLRVLLLAPLKYLLYSAKFDYYLVEMGIDSPNPPKNMDFLLSIIQPNHAIFLNAGLNHSFAFDQLVHTTDQAKRKKEIISAIAQEKAKLILSLSPDANAFLNFDDPNVYTFCRQSKAKIYSFGSKPTGDEPAGNKPAFDLTITGHQAQIKEQAVSTTFSFSLAKLPTSSSRPSSVPASTMQITIPNFLLPYHYAYSLACAILVGLQADLSHQAIKQSLENNLQLPLGRASVIEGKHDSTIIDSSYNASSMKDMIDLLGQIQNHQGRKLALLGDIRELGQETKQVHQEIATLACQSFDHIFLVGQEMRKYALPIISKKYPSKVLHYDNAVQAGNDIAKMLKSGDLILVKGSQNTIFLEEAVKKMMRNETQSGKLLCRQSAWWLNIKQQVFAK